MDIQQRDGNTQSDVNQPTEIESINLEDIEDDTDIQSSRKYIPILSLSSRRVDQTNLEVSEKEWLH